MRKLVMRDKTIVLIIFYSFTFLANAAYATDEEELLDAFFKATNYSLYSLVYGNNYDSFKDDRETAHNKLMLYSDTNENWKDGAASDCIEALLDCDVSLILLSSNIMVLRLGGGDYNKAEATLNEAKDYLIDANKAWNEVKNTSTETEDNTASDKGKNSGGGGCFVMSIF